MRFKFIGVRERLLNLVLIERERERERKREREMEGGRGIVL
jgi:hypothetical protein